MTARLVLHWHLDEVVDADGVLDSGDNHLNGKPEGKLRSVPDERFGSCLALPGDGAVTLVDTPLLALRGGYTAAAWVAPSGHGTAPATVVATAARTFAVTVAPDGSVEHVAGDGAVRLVAPAGTVDVASGAWRHLAATSDGRTVRTYVDGVLVAEAALPTDAKAAPDRDTLVVGRAADRTGWYDGRLAHVRVYDGALDADELRLDMAEDEAELAAFVRTYPVDFELVDADQHAVLFIDDTSDGQAMTLTVRNTSRQDLVPLPVAGPVSATDHHLALRMRAQTLAPGAQPTLATPGWTMARDGDTLYLLCTDPAPVAAGSSVVLRLRGMNADGRGGTRGTRVELVYRRLAFRGEVDELTGTRMQFLDVVNRRGRADAPLTVDLTGGDRVLSDGATLNTLVLRVANPSHDVPVRLAGADSPEGADAASALVVSFDVEHAAESRDRALVTAAAVPGTTLAVTGSSDPAGALAPALWPQPVRDVSTQRVSWRLVAAREVTVPPTGWIEITVGGIVAPVSLGTAPVSVDFVNVTGYADSTATVTVQKAPLLFSGQRVGIGTRTPMAALHVIDAPGDADAGALILGPVDGVNLRLGHAADHSWIQSHGSRPLALNPLGNNIGIGTTIPGSPLTVKASGNHVQLRRDDPATPGGNVLYLELFQAAGAGQVNPSIRFHQSQLFWHRIEARPDGFHLKTGDLGSDVLVDLHAGAARLAAATVDGDLSVHGRTMTDRWMQVVTSLAQGELEVDLYSFAQSRSLGVVTLRLVS